MVEKCESSCFRFMLFHTSICSCRLVAAATTTLLLDSYTLAINDLSAILSDDGATLTEAETKYKTETEAET